MDIRWTLDLVPVILHDPDLARMYQDRRRVDRLRFADLRRRFSAIPTLAEVVERYGSSRHLMLEVKDDCWPDPDRQNRILAKILKPLQPVTDFHFMALNPAVLAPLTGVPGNALLPIAYYWPKKMLRQVQNGPWGGLCGHYALMGDRLVQRLKSRGKQVGTGYADSPGCLFRELQRGVDWIFSNNAVQMQRVIRTALGGRQPQ
jgi:glycerophosphoryl diester phosphodiesterase